MKVRTSLLTRCVALVLALMMVVSGANLGIVFQAYAAENNSKLVGALMAENYDSLTDAEKALLKSGYLANTKLSKTYKALLEGLVSVDKEATKIIAESKDGWVPTTGTISYNGMTKEIDLSSGSYTYNETELGKAFSVEVNYKIEATVAVNTQKGILKLMGDLKQGIANLDAVAAQSGNLFLLEQAMPELVNLANTGVQTSFANVALSDECKAAIAAMNSQCKKNADGKLNLSVQIEAYEAGSKTAYLVNSGKTMQAEVAALYENAAIVTTALNTIYDNIGWLVSGGFVSQELANQIKTLAGVCNNLVNGLEAVNNDPWTAANTNVLANGKTAGTELDLLVAALGELTAVTPTASLLLATDSQTVNMSMFDVTVNVVLKTTQDNVVADKNTKTATVTLTEGATAAEILAAIEANGVESDAITAWGTDYVAGQFEKTTTTLPAELTENTTYTITYSPKNYTVTIAGEAAEYPYGYQLTLPKHEDPTKAYDYQLGEEKYAQGSIITVDKAMTFTREEGKSYTTGNLFAIIADCYGNSELDAILNSGALKGDELIAYRTPTTAELEELVKLEENKLTVGSYSADYEGLSWEPYSYQVDDKAPVLFNGVKEVTIEGDFTTVSVNYRLIMTNFTAETVKGYLDLALTLVDEAESQKSVLDKLAGYESQMAQINKNMLNGLSGVIGGYSNANGGGLHSDPAKNDELVAYFQSTISSIVGSCFDGQVLKLNNIIAAYNDSNSGGLKYYYQNDNMVRSELDALSGYLSDMLDGGDRQAALEKLMAENGYSDKVDVLTSLKDKLAEINADLKPVNAAISISDFAKLDKLVTAVTTPGAAYTEFGSPYISMGPITRTAPKFATVEVNVKFNGKAHTPKSLTIDKGTALTQLQVDGLKDYVESWIGSQAGSQAALYENDYAEGAALDALVGVALNGNQTFTFNWTAKDFVVKIAGEPDQTVNVNSLAIKLPAHPEAQNGMRYEYTIGAEKKGSGDYLFSAEQLLNLFVDDVYTIARAEKNEAIEDMEEMVTNINGEMGYEALTFVKDENGNYSAINAELTAENMMDFMMGMVMKSGYGYIGLNGEDFIYSTDTGLELCLQTLINAILKDNSFNQNTIIALGKNGKGTLFAADMQLGDSKTDCTTIDFVMNLKSVPAQLKNNVGLLEKVTNYITFQSNNGKLDIFVNLPDKVYGAYAGALIATGQVDKSDVNGMDNAVALAFLKDYLDVITGSNMDLTTYENTLRKLGIEKDIDQYNKYYTKAMNFYNSDNVTLAVEDGEAKANVSVSVPGKTVIDALLSVLKIPADKVNTYLPLLKEYKSGNKISGAATVTLKNADKTYYALIADVQADGITNKFHAPSGYAALADATDSLSGYSAVILLNDVPGNLTVSGTTVLDLNGKNVNGVINSTGNLIIIDSSMDTYKAGTVNGVSGKATVLAGNYKSDVKALLKDGYYMDGETVRNALYYIKDESGTVTFYLNADVYEDENVSGVLPNVKALAIDIASDLLLNYAMYGKLSVGGNELISINIEDLVGLYAGENRVQNLAKQLLDCVTIGEEGFDNNVGFEAVVNMILEDVMDFAAISDALANNTALATYEVTTEPWHIAIDHNTAENYATVDITTNAAKAKTFNVALAVESKYNAAASALAGELANIVVDDNNKTFAEVDIPRPSFANKKLTVTGAGKANVYLDMSKNEAYPVMMAVLLANSGNTELRAKVAGAINAAGGVDMDVLKSVIDNTSVADIFKALKVMNRSETFAAMAAKVGVTVDVSNAAELEAIYHTVLCGVGKILEKLGITGMNSKLGSLYNAQTGCYELKKTDIFRDKEITVRGYTALVELTADELVLSVKLFGEKSTDLTCMWGDVNHDDVVNAKDATLVLQYAAGLQLPANTDFCLPRADVNGDGNVNAKDATVILQVAAGIVAQENLPLVSGRN